MLEIFAYAIGIMYTPGPVNILGLHSGINAKARQHIGFFTGVAFAMLILFIFLGFVGLTFINLKILPYISFAGCSYILYIAWKVCKADVDITDESVPAYVLSFWDGLFMQLLNPKALVATLPIATIQFPAAGITGAAIVLWSVLLATLAFGAPASYSLAGVFMGKRLENPVYFKLFNLLMSVLLIYIALSIGYENIYLAAI